LLILLRAESSNSANRISARSELGNATSWFLIHVSEAEQTQTRDKSPRHQQQLAPQAASAQDVEIRILTGLWRPKRVGKISCQMLLEGVSAAAIGTLTSSAKGCFAPASAQPLAKLDALNEYRRQLLVGAVQGKKRPSQELISRKTYFPAS
jgi:hypothetical protein